MNNVNNINNIMSQIQNNPQILNNFKANMPKMLGNLQGVDMNNSNSIIQYGLNNGLVKQQTYNNIVGFLRNFGYKG